MALSARDRRTLLALVEQAQLVYLLTRYPRKQVLDDAADVLRLEKGLAAMRAAARELSTSLREDRAAVPWEELAKKPDTVELTWRKARRIAPTVLRELTPLLEGMPEAAFFLRPEPVTRVSGRRAPARPARAAKRPGRAGRST